MPRFVLLHHDYPVPHIDLLLEVGEVLWTWRLGSVPQPSRPCQATRIADHRPLYLDYEGPVSGNRGTVKRVAEGAFAWVENTPHALAILIAEGAFQGRMALARGQGGEWELTFDPAD